MFNRPITRNNLNLELISVIITLLCIITMNSWKYNCSISTTAKSGAISFDKLLHEAEREARESPHQLPTENIGAVVSLYSGLSREEASKRWQCQLQNHEQYATRHGYKYYFITDTDEWTAERESIPNPGINNGNNYYWFKLQVLRKLIHHHPWLLYLDTDSVFRDPTTAPPVEQFTTLGEASDTNKKSIYMPDYQVGWSTDIMLFRNTLYSKMFLKHVWNLRFACPNTVGEQGAFHIGLLDAIINEVSPLVTNGSIPDTIEVETDGQVVYCCLPRNHCEFPQADEHGAALGWQNVDHNNSPQGCEWNWQRALGFTKDGQRIDQHSQIDFKSDLRGKLKVLHPVKDPSDCKALNSSVISKRGILQGNKQINMSRRRIVL